MMIGGLETPDIPDFLRVTPAEAKRRIAWWAAHPPAASDAAWGSTLALNDALAPHDEPLDPKGFTKVRGDVHKRPGSKSKPERKLNVGEDRVAQALVNRDAMTESKYRRLMRDMPDDKFGEECRRILKQDFGLRLGSLAGDDVARHRPSKDERSRPKAAGRVQSPGNPGGAVACGRATPPAPASKPKKPIGAATGWKEAVIAVLRRPEGGTLPEIGAPHGWLDKTTSARLSAVRKEHTIESVIEEGRGRVYRIRSGAG